MQMTSTIPTPIRASLLPAFLAAFLLVMFLFYIDEGYYDFRWMTDAGNWFVFCLYMAVFFPIQWVIAHFIFGRLGGWKKLLAMIALSVPGTLLFFWLIF